MPIKPVTDPSILAQLNQGGNIVAPNPMFPGQMQGQGLNNAGQALTNQEKSATLPYAAPKAATDLNRARTEAGVAAATAPAEIAQKRANARQTAAQATTAEANLATTGGANEGQAKSASFYTRASRANQLYEATGVKDQPAGRSLAQTLLPDSWVNEFTSSARQQAETTQRDFIASTLRYESGANIPPNEFELQKSIYFPSPGDSPETIKLKAQLRANAIDGLRVASGPAASMLDKGQQELEVPQVAPATGKTVTEYDPQTAAAVDRMIRMGRPNQEIVAFAKSKGYNPPDNLDAAKLYLKQKPGYKGGFTVASKTRQTTAREQFSASPIGAALSSAGSAATLGLDDEAAGAISALQGGDYTQSRDAFNAGKEMLAGANPKASLVGTMLGSIAPFAAAGKVANAAKLPELLAPAARYGRTADEAVRIGLTRAGLATDAGVGAAYGAGESNEDRGGGAILGGMAGAGGNLAGRAVAGSLASVISPTGGKLAPLYALGVRPSIGQRLGGIANTFEEKTQSVPLVGDFIAGTRNKARDQYQLGLFNDALGQIGQQLPKGMGPGHAAHAFTQDAISKAYDDALSGMTAVADGELSSDLGSLQRTVTTLKPGSQSQFQTVWNDSVGRRFAQGGGTLAGDSYKRAESELSKKIAQIRANPNGDGELADALEQARDALRGSALRNSHPKAAAALDAADAAHARIVRLESASRGAGGEPAEFSPKAYNNAVRTSSGGVRNRNYLRGDALNSDLAAVGTQLGDKVSNSGSIDRLLAGGALYGLNSISPTGASLIGAYGALNAPIIRNLTTGLLAPRGGKARTVADILRMQLAGPAGTAGAGGGLGLLGLLPPQ